jgi:HSP20 family protein
MWAEACELIEQAERLRRQFFHLSLAPEANWEPPIDIFEAQGEVWVIAALPGVEPRDLEVYLDGEVLTVAGQRRLPAAARDAAIHRLEIPHGRFERRIRLSSPPLQLRRRELVNGCLVLTLAKQL